MHALPLTPVKTNRLAHPIEKRRPHSSLAWAAVALGVVFGVAGVSHTIAVISVALRQGKPYDFRLVSLLATGGVLVYPGLINIGISRWIGHGHPWALAMSAVVTLPLLVYEGFLFPRITPIRCLASSSLGSISVS